MSGSDPSSIHPAFKEAVQKFLDEGVRNISSPQAKEQFDAIKNASESIADSKDILGHLETLERLFKLSDSQQFREKGTDPEWSPPSGLAFMADGSLLISDDFNHRIQVFNSGLELIRSFGSQGKEPGQLWYPKGIAVDSEGCIYVADCWNHRVQKFDSEGNYLTHFGSYGSQKGQLNEPYDIWIESSGQLVVVERYNHRIQFFSPDGVSHGTLGQRGTVLEADLAHMYETPQWLLASTVFEFPTSIARDSYGNSFISDSGNHRILKFDSNWNQVLAFGDRGEEPGQFQYPVHIGAGSNDLLYVSDLNNNRIQVFDPWGQFIFAFDKSGDGRSTEMPCLVKADSKGRLVIGLTFEVLMDCIPNTPPPLVDTLKAFANLKCDDFYYQFSLGMVQAQNGDLDSARDNLVQSVDKVLKEKERSGADPDFDFKSAFKIPLSLTQLEAGGQGKEGEAKLIEGLSLFEEGLALSRDQMIEAHTTWETWAQQFFPKVIAHEALILSEREDPRVFDKEFHLAEKKDQMNLRNLRARFCQYRRAMESFAEYFCTVQKDELSKMAVQRCNDLLKKNLDAVSQTMLQLLQTKENNEEAMVAAFQSDAAEDAKWSVFREKYNCNERTFEVFHQCHFELRMLLRSLKLFLMKQGHHQEALGLAVELFSESSPHAIYSILLRTQENWEDHYLLDFTLKEVMDWVIDHIGLETIIDPDSTISFYLEDLKPVAFDVESLEPGDLLRIFWVEGLPLEKSPDGFKCGGQKVSVGNLKDKEEELISRLNEIFENKMVYENKHEELIQQWKNLRLNYAEQQAQLKKVDVRDKKAPIPINKTIESLGFQIHLVRRMIATLEFNELNNFVMLVLAGMSLVSLKSNPTQAKAGHFWSNLQKYVTHLNQQKEEHLKNRKEIILQRAQFRSPLNDLGKNSTPEELERSLNVQRNAPSLDLEIDILNNQISRFDKIRNLLENVLDLDSLETNKAKVSRNKLSFRNSIGQSRSDINVRFSPLGLTHTISGGFLAVDNYNHRVYRFTSQGDLLGSFGNYGDSPGAFKFPIGISTDTENCIYIADSENARIQKFSPEGEFLLSFGNTDEADFGKVFSLDVDAQNNIWTVDVEKNRVQVFDSNGKLLISFDEKSGRALGLNQPCSLCCLNNGGFLVGDQSDLVLRKYNAEGTLIDSMPGETLGIDAIFFIIEHPDFGYLLSDSWMHRLFQLDFDLKPVAKFDFSGIRRGAFNRVGGMSVFGNSLAIANYDHRRIQVYDLPKL